MSTIEEATDNLSPVSYKEIVEIISQNLKKSQQLLWAKSSSTSTSLRFDIDQLALSVAQQLASSNRYPFENRSGTTYASIHMPTGVEKEAFSEQIQQLVVRELQSLIQAQVGPGSIEQFVTSLLKPIRAFSDKNIVGLHYPLEKSYPFEKRKLHLEPIKTTDDPWLKGHKLTLHVRDINTFIAQVVQGICNYLEQQQVCDREDLEDTRNALGEMANNPKSPLRRLQDHVTKQSLARIQREAKVWYLAYLHQAMQRTWKAQDKEEGMKLLGTLIRRLSSIFFQEDFENNGGRDVLKYIAVEDASTSSEALCKLPLQIIFEPVYYYAADDVPETFTMTYETADLQALPIFLAPRIQDPTKYKVIERSDRIMLYYRHHPDLSPDSAQAFAYRFTYLLLAYVFIKVLAESISTVEKRKLFFPILCLHAKEKAPDQQDQKLDEETFMHALSKLLSHMLTEDYLSNSQGFYLDTVQGHGLNAHKLNSALYSLYTGLPRRFQLTQALQSSSAQATSPISALEKLAIIVVSSRKCDVNQKTPEQYQSTVFGEFVGIERLTDGYVRVSTLSTFSINQEAEQMYKRPEAIIEQVKVWYAAGYRHFLYIAQAPYSSTLHISDKASDEGLFFMNRDIIQAIRNVEKDIKVYPVFCDKYYVVNHKRKQRKPQDVDSLYVDDIGELSHLVNDPSKRSLAFFNLFNGASVKAQVYNGVMSYTTLMNVYEDDPTYDQYIWSDILGRSMPGSLKTDLLDFLTLLHFARYEKPRDFGFKLDPYKRIIGDTSIGKVSIFPHMKGGVRFNALAFLTLVRAVLRAQR